MKNNSYGFIIRQSILILITGLWSQIHSFSQEWSAQLYPQNNDYVEVNIDTRNMKGNTYLEDVSFKVEFYDQFNKIIDQQDINFTDGEVQSLLSGEIHRRFFQHSIADAKSALGIKLSCMVGITGGKADEFSQESKEKKPKLINIKAGVPMQETNVELHGNLPPSKSIKTKPVYIFEYKLPDLGGLSVYNPSTTECKPSRIRSRWKSNEYMNIENDNTLSSQIQFYWHSARWFLERVAESNFYRIRNFWKPNQYLHIESGYLQCGEIEEAWLSAYWIIEPVSGSTYYRIRNKWKNDKYLHIERGKLECSEIRQEWLSAQWIFETVY